jgi:hypothetical protein
MKDYKILMKDSTAGRIGAVVKTGAALAEVFLLFLFFSNVLHPQLDPKAKLAFGLAKFAFDVGVLLCSSSSPVSHVPLSSSY